MINPPDELLADLQSALPPEQQVTSPPPTSAASDHRANGHAQFDDHFYDRTSHDDPTRASVTSAGTVWKKMGEGGGGG